MSQPVSETVSSAQSLNISGTAGCGFITLQPQTTPPKQPASGLNVYSDGNNNICWKPAQGNIFTFNTMSTTASRVWTLPDSSSELATIDSLAVKEDKSKKGQPSGYASLGEDGKVPSTQLPSSTSGFSPSIVCVLYTTCTITAGNAAEANALTTIPPAAFASLVGFEPDVGSELSVNTASGDFTMDVLGTIYEFKIDTHWSQDAETGERRLISFIPTNGDLQTDQVSHREELGIITSTHGQTISSDSFVHVHSIGASGGFTAALELSAPNATADRIVDVRIRVIRWN